MLERTQVARPPPVGVGKPAGRWPVIASPCGLPVRQGTVRAPRRRGCLPHWPLSVLRQIERLLELLTTEILHPDSQAPSGVKSHFLEIFLEELSKVGATEVRAAGGGWRLTPPQGSRTRDRGRRPLLSPQLTADQNLKFIEPFCAIAARTQE